MTISTRQLRVGYRDRTVASIPDLSLAPGHVWLVTGANGSGKTTLLKTLAGLLPPVAGAIDGAPARGAGGAIFVHSTPVLFRGSLRHNLELTARDPANLHAVVERFGLSGNLDRNARELSHGVRQRTALARAILANPALLLLDEPEGGLDESALIAWRAFAQKAAADPRLTLVVAAHRPAGLDGVPTKVVQLSAAQSL